MDDCIRVVVLHMESDIELVYYKAQEVPILFYRNGNLSHQMKLASMVDIDLDDKSSHNDVSRTIIICHMYDHMYDNLLDLVLAIHHKLAFVYFCFLLESIEDNIFYHIHAFHITVPNDKLFDIKSLDLLLLLLFVFHDMLIASSFLHNDKVSLLEHYMADMHLNDI